MKTGELTERREAAEPEDTRAADTPVSEAVRVDGRRQPWGLRFLALTILFVPDSSMSNLQGRDAPTRRVPRRAGAGW